METPQFTAWGQQAGSWAECGWLTTRAGGRPGNQPLGFLVEASGSSCPGIEPSGPAGLLVQARADVCLPLPLCHLCQMLCHIFASQQPHEGAKLVRFLSIMGENVAQGQVRKSITSWTFAFWLCSVFFLYFGGFIWPPRPMLSSWKEIKALSQRKAETAGFELGACLQWFSTRRREGGLCLPKGFAWMVLLKLWQELGAEVHTWARGDMLCSTLGGIQASGTPSNPWVSCCKEGCKNSQLMNINEQEQHIF